MASVPQMVRKPCVLRKCHNTGTVCGCRHPVQYKKEKKGHSDKQLLHRMETSTGGGALRK